jgi:hypothetical protein
MSQNTSVTNTTGKLNLKVRFLGLFAYVPAKQKDQPLHVLGIDARAPGIGSDGGKQVSHLTSLNFDVENLATDREQPEFRYSYKPGEPMQGQWNIAGHDLEIRVNGKPLANTPLTLVKRGNDRKISLLPSMQALYPELGGLAVKRSCFTNADPLTAGLTMRMPLQAGQLGACAGKNGEYLTREEFELGPAGNVRKTRLTSCAEYETVLDATEIEIYSQQLEKGFVFRPTNGNTLELTFANMPPEGLGEAKPFHTERETDFELVYSIAQNRPVELRVPVRSAMAGEYPYPYLCPGAVFNPYD